MDNLKFNWKVAGFAGEGIMTTGLLFSRTCIRHGLHTFDYTEYPSVIRGGHNTYQVIVSDKKVYSQEKPLNLLVALNQNAITNHQSELVKESLVIYDQEDDQIDIKSFNLPGKSANIPLVKLAESIGGQRVMGNNVALGASLFFLGLDLTVLKQLIADIFADKGSPVINLNQKAAQAGFDYAQSHHQPLSFKIIKSAIKENLHLTGNEAAALGAIAGGLKFFSAYPMTPSSSVLHVLAELAPQAKIVDKHAEDEISAVNLALGASFAGARSMTATSGGGFCYMTEALGLSGVAELPLVIFEAMRPGPALGMPTWTAQGDLKFAINASQDEFPRIILAPADPLEAFELTKLALELAEKYQIPVIILSDKYLSESRSSLRLESNTFTHQRFGLETKPQSDKNNFFARYQITDSGISPRTLPGQPYGTHVANSYEHDQFGLGTEDGQVRISQMNKRFLKLKTIKANIPDQFTIQSSHPKLSLISFGSTKGPILAALESLKAQNININFLNLSWLWPFPQKQVNQFFAPNTPVVIVEGNCQGQLADLITEQTGHPTDHRFLKYDGRPFYPEEIIDFIKSFKA